MADRLHSNKIIATHRFIATIHLLKYRIGDYRLAHAIYYLPVFAS
jgi:hypothetical protein